MVVKQLASTNSIRSSPVSAVLWPPKLSELSLSTSQGDHWYLGSMIKRRIVYLLVQSQVI